MKKAKLGIVVPCYNEAAAIDETASRITETLSKYMEANLITRDSKVIFVDDGSIDETWLKVVRWHTKSRYVNGVKLARNFGHQGALMAGLMTCRDRFDCIITLDADLQDDVDVLKLFVQRYLEGNEIVYGVRRKRATDSFFKKATARLFYSLMRAIGVNLIANHADYRLLSKKALRILANYQESNLFLRGIVPTIGLKSAVVEYDRKKRFAGTSKYPFWKMIAFAVEGITSFSIVPIRLIGLLGVVVIIVCVISIIKSILTKFSGMATPGWTSLFVSIWFLGGVQLLVLGLVGEYIGKIYKEAKRRPQFTIDETLIKGIRTQRKGEGS
jgi:glycosyltransferase involved in cell wall biosynthesis